MENRWTHVPYRPPTRRQRGGIMSGGAAAGTEGMYPDAYDGAHVFSNENAATYGYFAHSQEYTQQASAPYPTHLPYAPYSQPNHTGKAAPMASAYVLVNKLRAKLRGMGVKQQNQNVFALVILLFFIAIMLMVISAMPSDGPKSHSNVVEAPSNSGSDLLAAKAEKNEHLVTQGQGSVFDEPHNHANPMQEDLGKIPAASVPGMVKEDAFLSPLSQRPQAPRQAEEREIETSEVEVGLADGKRKRLDSEPERETPQNSGVFLSAHPENARASSPSVDDSSAVHSSPPVVQTNGLGMGSAGMMSLTSTESDQSGGSRQAKLLSSSRFNEMSETNPESYSRSVGASGMRQSFSDQVKQVEPEGKEFPVRSSWDTAVQATNTHANVGLESTVSTLEGRRESDLGRFRAEGDLSGLSTSDGVLGATGSHPKVESASSTESRTFSGFGHNMPHPVAHSHVSSAVHSATTSTRDGSSSSTVSSGLQFMTFKPTERFNVDFLISQLSDPSAESGPLPRSTFAMGVVTFIVAPNAGIGRQMEAIHTFSRIQALGIPGIHEPWQVPVTLFTTVKTVEHLAAQWKREVPRSVSWPFEKVVLLDQTQLVETAEQYSLPACCTAGCCKHPNPGTKRDKWSMKIAAIRHSPYDVTLYLDSDIYACDAQGMAEHVMSVVGGSYDLRITDDKQNGGGDLTQDITENGTLIPPKFFERNTGLIVYDKRVPVVRSLLDRYSKYYLEQLVQNPTIKHDQPAFRRALYEVFDKIKHEEIKRTEHCRGTWMYRVEDGSALRALDCIYAHGDNRTRSERLLEFPCRGDSLDKYIPLVGRIAQNGLTWK